MAAQQKPEPTGVAVARPQLPPAAVAAIEERKLRNAVIQQIRGATWSKDLSPDGIRAVAQWCRENDVDAATEVDVLGGRLYVNARYYERILSKLIAVGVIDYARGEWVHADKRLDTLAAAGDAWAVEESNRRLRLRIEYRLSDEADAAMVYRIKHRAMTEPVIGTKEHIAGRKKTIRKKDGGSFTVDADPVGDQAPSETVETRALRRAMLKLKESMPDLRVAVVNDEQGVALQEVIDQSHEDVQELRAAEPGQRQLAAASDFSGYGLPVQEEAPAPLTRTTVEDVFDAEEVDRG